MKCLANRNKIIDLSEKRMQIIIPQTSKFTTAMTVYILFNNFRWSVDRVKDFLCKYDKYSQMIVQTKYDTLPYDERPKEGWTFKEFNEMCGSAYDDEGKERYKLHNSCVKSDNLVIMRTQELQDYCLAWILDVIIMTLQDKFGWHSFMCNKFSKLYDDAIPLLKDYEFVYPNLLQDLKNRFDFELEIQ
ncbi:MAG: hypothetical protein J6S85_02430 [Methanobrevibacter sp.]|nr:hypothetical protein [Methanobrevibacter sp.]